MTSLVGIIGTLAVFAFYGAIIWHYMRKNQKLAEERFWQNYNNYLENP